MNTTKILLTIVLIFLASFVEASTANTSIYPESDETKFRRLTKEIEVDPFSESAPETRKWLISWLEQSKNISVLACDVLGTIPETIPYSSEIVVQMLFSNASYQMLNHANNSSELELQIAGIEGALNAYLNILKIHPESRIPYLDNLQEMRQSGKLVEYMRPIVAKNCKGKNDNELTSTEKSQPELESMVESGFNEIKVGNTSNAISLYLNPVIESYESKNYGKKVYCARTKAESMLYLMQAAKDKKDAIVIEPIWAQAYFLKGYASLDLGRQDEAKKWLSKALELSPANSGYNSELAHIYQLEMKWKESIELFRKAEEYAISTSPESVKNIELLRAKRGIAYVLVEQGNLEEAKKVYKECLAIDPNDEKSKKEMKYIQQLESRKSEKKA